MKPNIVLALSVIAFSVTSNAANNEPDESGIGGTGRTVDAPDVNGIFRSPELPERIEIAPILPPDLPEVMGGAANVPDTIDPPTTGTPTSIPTPSK